MIIKKESEYVKKRKSYYGFAKNYPGKLGTNKYVIGDSLAVRKKETIRRIIIAFIILLLFSISFVVTTVCIKISEKPIDTKNISVTEIQDNSKNQTL